MNLIYKNLLNAFSKHSVKVLTIEAPDPWPRWVWFCLWGQSGTASGEAPSSLQPERCAWWSPPSGPAPGAAPQCERQFEAAIKMNLLSLLAGCGHRKMHSPELQKKRSAALVVQKIHLWSELSESSGTVVWLLDWRPEFKVGLGEF